MNRNRLPPLAIGLTAILCGIPTVTADDFFTPAPDRAASLDPDGIYPQGRMIGFGLYSIYGQNQHDPGKTNMQRVADAGFTLAGPYYDPDPTADYDQIADAAALGLKFTVGLRPHASLVGVELDDRPTVIAALSDDDIYQSIRAQMIGILSDPQRNAAVARWALEPEELRYWLPEELRYLRVAHESVRRVEAQFDHPARPFWMYEENYRTSDALEQTGAHQELVGKGVYLTGNFADATTAERGDQRSGFAIWGYTQILDAADQLDATPQAFLQMAGDFTDPLTGTDPAQIRKVMRHDTYLGLVMGIKSLNIWSMYEFRDDFTTHNEQFEAYGSVAHDLTGPLNLQEVFLFGERRDDLAITVESGQQQITYIHNDDAAFTFDALHVANIADKSGRRFVILVNSSEEAMSVRLDGLPSDALEPLHVNDLFHDTQRLLTSPELIIELDPLGVKVLLIPEPASCLLASIGMAALLLMRKYG